MLRNDLLDAAKAKINVDRADVYGDAKLNHQENSRWLERHHKLC